MSTSRLYPGPRGPSCDLSLLVGSCKPPHFTSAGGIHTNNLHVSINSCDFVRSPACAAASRAHVYGSFNSLNTSCGVISKPHFEVLGRGAFFFSRQICKPSPHQGPLGPTAPMDPLAPLPKCLHLMCIPQLHWICQVSENSSEAQSSGVQGALEKVKAVQETEAGGALRHSREKCCPTGQPWSGFQLC